ncbi:hypothetical protein Mapa_014666 [Marchantia paleacea]|nr:hypothetical protein Mapa_014666 [Marchantia paleacea]
MRVGQSELTGKEDFPQLNTREAVNYCRKVVERGHPESRGPQASLESRGRVSKRDRPWCTCTQSTRGYRTTPPFGSASLLLPTRDDQSSIPLLGQDFLHCTNPSLHHCPDVLGPTVHHGHQFVRFVPLSGEGRMGSDQMT